MSKTRKDTRVDYTREENGRKRELARKKRIKTKRKDKQIFKRIDPNNIPEYIDELEY